MNLTVLVDNNTLIDHYFIGEPAVSYLIKCANKTYLFDTGYSNVFLQNAKTMQLTLSELDGVIISHGHDDHTRGLLALNHLYETSVSYKKPQLIAHPAVFRPKRANRLSIGCPLSLEKLQKNFVPRLSKNPVHLTEHLIFLGEIERCFPFEANHSIGEECIDNIWREDYVLDDSALVYKAPQGLVIITGCSHSGICNIIEYAKKVCCENRIYDIIGGFHLLQTEKQQMESTLNYFKTLHAHAVYAGHCTDLSAKINLAKVANIKELGVGLELNY
ncbi:MAG: MBL fold metallo-hydrolase [Selenomonadaceae bacterium]